MPAAAVILTGRLEDCRGLSRGLDLSLGRAAHVEGVKSSSSRGARPLENLLRLLRPGDRIGLDTLLCPA